MLLQSSWQGIAALTAYRTNSHVRHTILTYLACRARYGYFWGSRETIAKECNCSLRAASEMMQDLEAIGAISQIPHDDLPAAIRKHIEKHYPLQPAKKVWMLNDSYTINGVVYQYLYTGDGGDKSNVTLRNNYNSSPNIESIKEEKKENQRTDDANASSHATPEPQPAKEKPTPVKRSSPEYKAIEEQIRTHMYQGGTMDFNAGNICAYLVLRNSNPALVAQFIAWYKAGHPDADIPRDMKRIKGTDQFIGKFGVWWEKFEQSLPAAHAADELTLSLPNGQIIKVKPNETERIAKLMTLGAVQL